MLIPRPDSARAIPARTTFVMYPNGELERIGFSG